MTPYKFLRAVAIGLGLWFALTYKLHEQVQFVYTEAHRIAAEGHWKDPNRPER